MRHSLCPKPSRVPCYLQTTLQAIVGNERCQRISHLTRMENKNGFSSKQHNLQSSEAWPDLL